MIEANRAIYELLKDSVKVTITDPEGDDETVEVLRMIDWGNPENNDFFLASQFWYNALIILSNGSESRVGSLTASWEHFAEWKHISREEEQGVVSLDTILRGLCAPRCGVPGD